MSPEELAQMSGTNAYKGGHVGGSYYDTITLGKDGKFYLSFYSQLCCPLFKLHKIISNILPQ